VYQVHIRQAHASPSLVTSTYMHSDPATTVTVILVNTETNKTFEKKREE
jgi:hypothetical protein